MDFKLFRERAEGEQHDLFIANLREVDIVRSTWRVGNAKTRTPIFGSITTRSDVDLSGELLAGKSYFLSGAEGDRFDFEISHFGRTLTKTGEVFKIGIL